MKKLTTPLLTALLALSASSRLAAAEPESAFGLAPSAAPQIQPSAPSSLPLIPESPEPLEKPAKADKPATATATDRTAVAEDLLKKKIALRQARMKAERDPKLQAVWQQALDAKTDFEQRKIFIDYYTSLVDRIVKFNPGMTKAEIETLRTQYTGRFFQVRIAPTIDPAIARAQQ